MKKDLIIEIISAILILLFAHTAISKLIEHETFSIVLSDGPLLKPYAPAISWLVPITEIGIVLLLFLPSSRITGLFASLALLLLFTFYLLYMIVYAAYLPCNCGGVIARLSWKQHILFNIFFVLLSSIAILLNSRGEPLELKTPP